MLVHEFHLMFTDSVYQVINTALFDIISSFLPGPLDVDKFISFPGFNIDPDEHTIDVTLYKSYMSS